MYRPKEASTEPGTQQTLRDCSPNKRMAGRMGGWLDMITGSYRQPDDKQGQQIQQRGEERLGR